MQDYNGFLENEGKHQRIFESLVQLCRFVLHIKERYHLHKCKHFLKTHTSTFKTGVRVYRVSKISAVPLDSTSADFGLKRK